VTQLQDVLADLTVERDELHEVLARLDDQQWLLPTPAPGWTVAHQVAHLAATFRIAALAAQDAAAFGALAGRLGPDFDANVAQALAEYLADPPPVLLARWRAESDSAIKALSAAPPDRPVPWLVNPLPPAVLASAGLMEVFAHGQDVLDTVGVVRRPTDRIGHLVAFAVRTWDFGYLARGLTAPDVAFRFELTAPSGAVWAFGPADAAQRITGPAIDFCLLVTRRRHHCDLAVTALGDDARHWLEIAQAYRGPAGPGRAAGQFAA